MFLSVNKEYPGFEHWQQLVAQGKKVRIFLDGTELERVVFVDDLNKYVIVTKLNEKGFVCIDKKKGEILTETKYGTVVIEVVGEYRTLPP